MSWIQSPIKALRQRIHSLAQSKFEVVDIGSIWQSANGFPQTVVIVVQERQPLGQTKKGQFVGRLRHIEIMLMLPNGDLDRMKARHQPPYERHCARHGRCQSGDRPFKKPPGAVFWRRQCDLLKVKALLFSLAISIAGVSAGG